VPNALASPSVTDRAAPTRRKATTGAKRERKVERVMHEFSEDKLHSGSKRGPKVRSRAQAVAIGLSEAKRRVGNHPKRAM